MIQSILFNNKKWSELEVENYIRENNIKKLKPIHSTDNYFRVRVHKPEFDSYMTTHEKNGIRYVIGFNNTR